MEIMIILISASLLLALFFLYMFIKASRKGQFRDTYTPSVRILFEDKKNWQLIQNNMNNKETFHYDNKIVKWFAYATMLWALVGMLVGLLVAFQLVFPDLNLDLAQTTFGRTRPLHTNAIIFAFVGNGIFWMGFF